jgi:predicted phosphodiesterase
MAASDVLERIGVIGDDHARDKRLEQLIAFLEEQALDALTCVGDVVNGPGDPNACAAVLESASVITVRGNHDRWLLEGSPPLGSDTHQLADLTPATLTFLRALPTSLELPGAGNTPLVLCHGLPEDDMSTLTSDDYGYALEVNDELQRLLRDQQRRIVVKGHRHRPAVWRLDELTLIDAGSLLDSSPTGGAVVDILEGTVTPIAFGDVGPEFTEPIAL